MSIPMFPVEPLSMPAPAVVAWLRRDGWTGDVTDDVLTRTPGDLFDLESIPLPLHVRDLESRGLGPVTALQEADRERLERELLLACREQADRLRHLVSAEFLRQRVSACRGVSRRSRIAHWWWAGSRVMILLAAVTAVLVGVAAGVLAWGGWNARPLWVIGAVLVGLITITGTVLALTARTRGVSSNPDLSDVEWAQFLAAQSLAAQLPKSNALLDAMSGHRLSDIVRDQGRAALLTGTRDAYWSYRNLVLDLARSRQGSTSYETSSTRDHADALESLAGQFQPDVDLPGLAEGYSRADDDDETDSSIAGVLALVSSLVIAIGLTLAVSTLTVSRSCDYAKAEVRIAKCKDLTGLPAAGLELPSLSLPGRDLTDANFSNSAFEKSDLAKATLQYALLVDAEFPGVKASGAIFTGADAAGVTMTRADLKEAVLDRADFSKADFSDASMVDVSGEATDFTGADLTDVDLTGADLTFAVLEGASLEGAKFVDANLSFVDLRGTNFRDAVLTGADLSGVDLSGVDLSGLKLDGLTMDGANFAGANLTNTSLRDTSLLGANFEGATITGLVLQGATLADVSVKSLLDGGANLEGVDLSGADLVGLSGTDFTLTRATLRDVDLSGLDLRKANFDGSDLTGADLSEADLRGASLVGADLSEAKLQLADLSQARMQDVDFSRADLTEARSIGTDLQRATFTGADLRGADFAQSNLTGARGLSPAGSSRAVWTGATCPDGKEAEICSSL